MNTQENNKLIAEFMGVYQDDKGYWGFTNTKEHQRWHTDRFVDATHYHTDWNWLMDVVSKIESLGYWLNKIDGDYWIVNDNGDTIIDNTEHSGGIIAVYNACVEFIKWHNKQK